MSYPSRNNGPEHSYERVPSDIWKRGFIMLFFIIAFGVAQSVLFFIAFVQFFWMLFKSERNVFIAQLGYSLSVWLAEATRYLTGDSEERPFPWKPWPGA